MGKKQPQSGKAHSPVSILTILPKPQMTNHPKGASPP